MPRISDPRGIPHDLDPRTELVASWEHSMSWLSLSEVLAFDWDQLAAHHGLLPVFSTQRQDGFCDDSYEQWIARCDGKEPPESYCQGRSGVRVSLKAAAALISGTHPDAAKFREAARRASPGEEAIVWATWTEPLRDSCPDFIEFVAALVLPLLGTEYAALRMVLDDAREARGEARGAVWGDLAKTPHEQALHTRMRQLEESVRFVFGFDS